MNDRPEEVVAALRAQQLSLKKPPLSIDELFAIFERHGLAVAELRGLMES